MPKKNNGGSVKEDKFSKGLAMRLFNDFKKAILVVLVCGSCGLGITITIDEPQSFYTDTVIWEGAWHDVSVYDTPVIGRFKLGHYGRFQNRSVKPALIYHFCSHISSRILA